jgi:hypothetical protein
MVHFEDAGELVPLVDLIGVPRTEDGQEERIDWVSQAARKRIAWI